MPNEPDAPRRVTVTERGPVLVEGPVEVTGPDGVTHVSDRFVVAVCTCRRSRTLPWCDTSHRRRAGQRTASPEVSDPLDTSASPGGPGPSGRRARPAPRSCRGDVRGTQ
ncbi:CDGSH iron-sulfur domain-containing protein [Streptomyces sp. PTD5-9]|uniref:CDGSH iron-sulfur domain-containing protein n=1 Tax=Streptomyces sp. PTD5-9 TaxID=3120150 RepID=UPI00300B4774